MNKNLQKQFEILILEVKLDVVKELISEVKLEEIRYNNGGTTGVAYYILINKEKEIKMALDLIKGEE